MKKSIFAFVGVVSIAFLLISSFKELNETTNEFHLFKQTFGRNYKNQIEEDYRRAIFYKNVASIEKHNADLTQTYKQGINQFTDKTQEELVNMYLTPKMNLPISDSEVRIEIESLTATDIDWQALGKVSVVKNQGSGCGSSWAFSAIGAVESAFLIANVTNETLSDQQAVDCTDSYGNSGCMGGWMNLTFKYIIDKGITTETAYPYTGKSQKCQADGGKFKISKYANVFGCTNLINALSNTPISSAPDATNWFPYKSGIFSNCGSQPNHGAIVVGYTNEYWKVKNCWGPTWGENGFIRLAPGNTCRVCDYGSYPIL